jgi:ankyrin repeat protein
MYSIVNSELYRLVIKYKMFCIAHWAAEWNRMGTLKIALAHGANPNQMRTWSRPPRTDKRSLRPIGSNILTGTALELDLAVRRHLVVVGLNHPPATPLRWHKVWFSSASLSTVSSAQMNLLSNHYLQAMRSFISNGTEQLQGNDHARLVGLPKPLDENFAFPENMSPTDMDRRDVKIGFVQLFRHWDTPLHIAALYNRVSVTEALLANGANVDCTATHVCSCVMYEMPTSVRRAHTGGNHIAAYTPLHVAICVQSFEVARVLVASGAERMAMMFTGNDDREWLSENPLHRALSNRPAYGFNYNFIKFLLDHGYAARIEERNHEGLTPLLIALHPIGDPAQVDAVKLLLRYDADPNNPGPCSPGSKFHGRPLMAGGGGGEWAAPALWATREGNFKLAELLLKRGADARARSSILGETMLYAACTATDYQVLVHKLPVKHHRMELLDALLAGDAASDLNIFDRGDRTQLMNLIIFKIFGQLAKHTGEWESKLFRAGADIMAGADMGKHTAFETMIDEVLETWVFKRVPLPSPTHVGDTMLAILKASRIDRHVYRPRAFLNQFWGHVGRTYHRCRAIPGWQGHLPHFSVVTYMLSALMKAGFSPEEVDRHGDTAMTSFLQWLLDTPQLATSDSKTHCHEGWLLPMIMALLQQHGAALQRRNNKGCTAFDYLKQMVNYDGEDEDLAILCRVMRRSVAIGMDAYGDMCFKFHPMKVFGGLSDNPTLQRLLNNRSSWLVCEHFCGQGHCSTWNRQCTCARTSFQTFAKCEGDCCPPR